jgi:hypothetical protein
MRNSRNSLSGRGGKYGNANGAYQEENETRYKYNEKKDKNNIALRASRTRITMVARIKKRMPRRGRAILARGVVRRRRTTIGTSTAKRK